MNLQDYKQQLWQVVVHVTRVDYDECCRTGHNDDGRARLLVTHADGVLGLVEERLGVAGGIACHGIAGLLAGRFLAL